MILPPTFQTILDAHREQVEAILFRRPVEELRVTLQDALYDLERQLASARPGTFTAVQAQLFLTQVKVTLLAVEDSLGSKYKGWRSTIQRTVPRHIKEMLDVGVKNFGGSTLPLPEAALLRGVHATLDRSLLDRFQTFTRKYTVQTIRDIEAKLARGLLANRSIDEMAREILDSNRGLFGKSWKAERIVRTELSYAYNTTYLEDAKQLSRRDRDLHVRWTELVDDVTKRPLDARVGEDSIALHGQVRAPGEAFADTVLGGAPLSPPNRPHDRGRLIVVRKSWTTKAA